MKRWFPAMAVAVMMAVGVPAWAADEDGSQIKIVSPENGSVVKGDALELKFTIKFEGNDLPITMKGKVTGGEMKGSADYGGLAEGEFKGKKN